MRLADGVIKELTAAARPGKAEILLKVFADAMNAYAEGDVDEAIRLGDQSKHMALRSVSVREFLGVAYYAAEKWKEAALELAAFRRMTGSTSQNHVIADSYRAMKRPDKALEYCDEITRDVGDEVFYEGQIVAAGALVDMGRVDDAIGRLLRLGLQPSTVEEHHIRAWYVLGDLLERKGKFTQAKRWFDAVTAADPGLTDRARASGATLQQVAVLAFRNRDDESECGFGRGERGHLVIGEACGAAPSKDIVLGEFFAALRIDDPHCAVRNDRG